MNEEIAKLRRTVRLSMLVSLIMFLISSSLQLALLVWRGRR